MRLRHFAEQVHALSKMKGWWDDETDVDGVLIPSLVEKQIPTKLCLMHSEISEALEEYRSCKPLTYFNTEELGAKPEGLAVELIDNLIRTLDLLVALGVNVEYVAQLKHEYNVTRPFRHGGKKI